MSLLLVDGNGLLCQLWWADPAEAPARFASRVSAIADGRLAGLATESHPMRVTCCWDSPAPTWRHEIMPTYKQGRPSKPEALREALRECRMLRQFKHIEAPGFEADDLIGTLARDEVFTCAHTVYILSSDKDFAQLVGPRCQLINARGEITDAAAVERKFGVPPSRIRHYLSWCGDSSDGLPGVKGVGPKRAIAKALAGEIGDPLTWELVELATVPELLAKAPERARIKAQEADYAGFHYESADEPPPAE